MFLDTKNIWNFGAERVNVVLSGVEMPGRPQCTIEEEGEGEKAGEAFSAKTGKILYLLSRIWFLSEEPWAVIDLFMKSNFWAIEIAKKNEQFDPLKAD